jgi:hypothetical protein
VRHLLTNIWLVIWLVAIPPLAFLVLDVLATMVLLLLAEPGITPEAAFYYHIVLLPGTLFVNAHEAMFVNMVFGLVIGGILYLIVTWRTWFTRNARRKQRPS